MRKRYPGPGIQFLIVIQLLILSPVQAKTPGERTDSLRQIIRSHPSDEKVADAMIAMAIECRAPYLNDSSRLYAERALAISNRINYLEGMAMSSLLIINFQWLAGQLDEARASIPRLIQLTKQLEDDDKLGLAFYHVGIVSRLTGALDSAIYYFKASLALELKDTLTIISDYVDLGATFMDLAVIDSAIYYYLRAASIAESSGIDENLGRIIGNIGNCFRMLGDYDEAQKYYRRGLEISRKHNNVFSAANIMGELGILYSRHGDIANALACLDESNEMFKSIGVTIRSDIYLEYALIYEKLGKYNLAVEYCRKSLEISKVENDVAWLMRSLIIFGHIYTSMGKSEKARSYLDSAINIAIEKGYKHDQMDLMKLSAANSFAMGNYDQAYIEFGAFFNLYDSMNIEKTKVITELRIKYAIEKDQARILALEKETLKRTLQRNLFLFNSSALLVAGLFLWVILRHKLVKTRLIAQHKIQQLEEQEKIVTARKLLEGQEMERKRIAMELHDGLGVMLSATKMQFAAIQDHIKGNYPSVEKAVQILEQATHEVRRISHNMMPGLLTKLGLYEAVEDLFDNVNEMEKIHASVEIKGARSRLPENIEIMIYRIIQEMVNNTLKYANARNIELSIKISNPSLVIKYKDDGIGFEMERILKSDKISLGLKSIESRVGFLNGELKIDSSPGNGVSYLIKVPVKA